MLCLGCFPQTGLLFVHQGQPGVFGAMGCCHPTVLVDPPPAHLDPTYLSIQPTPLQITHSYIFTSVSTNRNVNSNCELCESWHHRWPTTGRQPKTLRLHICCVSLTPAGYVTLVTWKHLHNLLQDAPLTFQNTSKNSSKMAFRSRARQFERKLSQTFLSKLRGRERERSSVEVVNSSPSGFMRVVTRCSLGCGVVWYLLDQKFWQYTGGAGQPFSLTLVSW